MIYYFMNQRRIFSPCLASNICFLPLPFRPLSSEFLLAPLLLLLLALYFKRLAAGRHLKVVTRDFRRRTK